MSGRGSGTRRGGPARRGWGVLAAAVLAGEMVISALGMSAPISPSGTAAPSVSTRAFDRWDPELVAPLIQVLRTRGTSAALDRIPEVLRRGGLEPWIGHDLAHGIGLTAYEIAGGDPAEAFSGCKPDHNFGCYHGVTEAFLRSLPDLRALDRTYVSRLCSTRFQPGQEDRLSGSCQHGLGHGLAVVLDYDLTRVLDLCSGLERGQETCYDGVFMEAATAAKKGELAGYLRDDEPWYPCTAVATEYRGACYRQHTSNVVERTGRTTDALAAVCRGVPADVREACVEGVGRATYLRRIGELQAVTSDCGVIYGRIGRERDICVNAVLFSDPTSFPRTEIAPLCFSMDDPEQIGRCYGYLGHRLFSEGVTDGERERVCAMVPIPYGRECRYHARVGERRSHLNEPGAWHRNAGPWPALGIAAERRPVLGA